MEGSYKVIKVVKPRVYKLQYADEKKSKSYEIQKC